MNQPIHFLVPGRISQRTGGYLYDLQMLRGMRERGATVHLHELPGEFPGPDPRAEAELHSVLESCRKEELVLIDGLAGGAFPEVLAAHAERLRCLFLVHHPLYLETGLSPARREQLQRLEGQSLLTVRNVITSSAFTAEALRSWLGTTLHIETCIPGTARFPQAPGPGPQDPPGLLCLGSRIPRKGQDILVRALAEVADLDWTAILAGAVRDAHFDAALQTLIRQKHLEARIECRGDCDPDTLQALFLGASLFVFPSWYEGYGMALTEAMGHGLPIISTTGGAIPHTVPPQAGWLVPPGDVPALASALRQALTDTALRERCALAARHHAVSLPDWDEAATIFYHAVRRLGCVDIPDNRSLV